MEPTENSVQITLYDETGEPSAFYVDRVFAAADSPQQYCCAWPADGREEPVFLRCELIEDDGKGTASLAVAEIPSNEEYASAVNTYLSFLNEDAGRVTETLNENEDFITMTDADGNQIPFIVHTIFKDEMNGHQYIAAQRVDDAGEIAEEISIYRYNEYPNQEYPEVEMIRSSMEYDRARQLLMDLIEGTG